MHKDFVDTFHELLSNKEYDFLRTEPHLGDNIVLLTLGGSHAPRLRSEQQERDPPGQPV